MKFREFTKPSDYGLIAKETNNVIRQIEQIWKDVLREEGGVSEDGVRRRKMMANALEQIIRQ
jgi:hypothetical protein